MSEPDNKHFEINTEVLYLPDQSEPDAERYAFAYTVTIRNVSELAAQLTHRHWYITDANGATEEVHGEGIIGAQPHFKPGDSYQYTSGVVLRTPVGAMRGHYEIRTEQGDNLKAAIAPFTLSVPGVIN